VDDRFLKGFDYFVHESTLPEQALSVKYIYTKKVDIISVMRSHCNQRLRLGRLLCVNCPSSFVTLTFLDLLEPFFQTPPSAGRNARVSCPRFRSIQSLKTDKRSQSLIHVLRRSFQPPLFGFPQRNQVRDFPQPIRDASGHCRARA